ncbi:MAG: hypothetical protein QNL12_00655 [Acidimicrobiia bacterium]|nr:hypothetical protein [Acidimicrobiia bacterium]MDX2465796.1 hypothetical protein [Acidimicrobiia bacterium]
MRASALLEIGAALALVGAIFVLERRFVRQVGVESAATERRFEARTSAIEQKLDNYRIRLENLRESTEDVTHRCYAHQNEAIAALEENISHASVVAALDEANRLHSISELRVQASGDILGMRLVFARYSLEPGWDGPDNAAHEELVVRPHFIDEPVRTPLRGILGSGGTPIITWRQEWTVAELCDRVIELLQEANRYAGPATFSPEVAFKTLGQSLAVAIASRRGDDPSAPHLQGKLIEMVDDDWFLTDEGLECPTHQFVLASHQIHPAPIAPKGMDLDGNGLQPQPRWTEPEPPGNVSADRWKILLRLATDAVPRPRRFDQVR